MSRIVYVNNCGTIVLVGLDDRPQPVAFDHRMFKNMAEARGGDLRGECHLEGEPYEEVLVFEDDDDAVAN